MRRPLWHLLLLCVAVLLPGCRHTLRDPREVALRYEWLGNIEESGFREPSGLTFDPTRGSLFCVGDEGDICELSPDGRMLRQAELRPGADLEGVTRVPQTGLLYVAVEGEDAILETDPATFRVLREFSIPRRVGEELLLQRGGQGLEGICFLPDPSHPQGGTFFVANQSFTEQPGEERSLILEVELPLRRPEGTARVLNWFSPRVIDIAGLHWDAASCSLLAVSDSANILLRLLPDGRILRVWSVTGANQEGIAVDGEGLMYIAQDSGGIIKIRPLWEP